MKDIKFEFNASSQYIKLIDNVLNTEIKSLLSLLSKNCNTEFGFNYELGGTVKQYYSNVHATILFNLFLLDLLNNNELKVLQDALFRLRDFNPNAICEKAEEDKYAWDVIEGPNSFSTALACYSLLLTKDTRLNEIKKSMKWLLRQRNDKEIWSSLKKGNANNYVTTLYSILSLRLLENTNYRNEFKDEIKTVYTEVINFIEESFIKDRASYYVLENNDASISNTIVCLYLLKILDSSKFDTFYNGAKKAINKIVLEDKNWYRSTLSDIRDDSKIKSMYTYNPSYINILLQLGWNVVDSSILKMIFWIISDLRTSWNRKDILYPWRSSDSIIQSFVCSFSIYTTLTWIKEFLKQNILNVETNLFKLISGRDVFICHVSEDKEEYIKPFYQKIVDSGISVWYDEGEILWGDSISKKIDDGITISKFAIICFSKNFLKKDGGWSDVEFRNLFQRQQAERRKIILPLILNSKDEVIEKYTLLKDISFEEWDKGIDYLNSQLKKILEISAT